MDDPYLKIIDANWAHILRLYHAFADRAPIMLFDIQEQRVYAYPYKDFRAGLNVRSRASLAKQYRDATAARKMVLFVRDNEARRLVSYSLAVD